MKNINEYKKIDLDSTRMQLRRYLRFVLFLWICFYVLGFLVFLVTKLFSYNWKLFPVYFLSVSLSCGVMILWQIINSIIGYCVINQTDYFNMHGKVIDLYSEFKNGEEVFFLKIKADYEISTEVPKLFYDHVEIGRDVDVCLTCRGNNTYVSRIKLC